MKIYPHISTLVHWHIRYTLQVTSYIRKTLMVLRSYGLTVFFLSPFSLLPLSAQQVQLKGVVTVQNSKTYTGKTQFVKNAEVTHPKAKPELTDDDGKFTLNITGEKPNSQIQISVFPYGEFTDYVVVNEKELKDITLGRLTPVSVFVCKKGELEKRQAEMVGINMRKLEEKMEVDKKRLQKELDAIRANNDYLNVRYSEIKDSLDILSKNIDNAFERIKEYAKTMTLENLDDRDENYVKAYDCFSRGALDSVSYYLQEQDLDLKYQKIVQLQQEAKKEKELAAVLTESAKAKEEFTENSMNELIKEWLLLARTANLQNDYEKTMLFYEKVIQVDSLNVNMILTYTGYLMIIDEFKKAEKYFDKSLEIIEKLITENSEEHLITKIKILNDYGLLHFYKNEFSTALEYYNNALNINKKNIISQSLLSKILHNRATLYWKNRNFPDALKDYEESLLIRKALSVENPKEFLKDMAQSLVNMGVLYYSSNDFTNALPTLLEALRIYKELEADNPKSYSMDLAKVLANLAYLHRDNNEHIESLKKFEEALILLRELSAENPKFSLPTLANALCGSASVYWMLGNFLEALEQLKESLSIYEELVAENPAIYQSERALTLIYSAMLHGTLEEFSLAFNDYEEALRIYRKLAAENPNAYSYYVALVLYNIADLRKIIGDYTNVLDDFKESLRLFKKLAEISPGAYQNFILTITHSISTLCISLKEYVQAEQFAREALEMDSNKWDTKIHLAHALLFQNRFSEAKAIYKEFLEDESAVLKILNDFDDLKKADLIPEENKNEVEEIRKMILGD